MNEDLLAAVQGRWRILAVEEDGQREEGQPSDELFAIIRGDEFRVESHGQYFPDDRPSRFRCDPKRHRFDFLDSTGVVESPGIYCLDGMQLQICAALRVLSAGPSLPSRPPTSFVTTNGSGWRLWVMHRAAALRHGGQGVGGGGR